MSCSEEERLRRVYAHYRESPHFQALWDPRSRGNRAMNLERFRAVERLLRTHGFQPLTGRALDIGCGSGGMLAGLLELGAESGNLYGLDLLPQRIAVAQQNCPGMHFSCGNAEALPFAGAHFDLVLLSTVFSSILDDAMAANVAREAARVLRPSGAVLWYDLRFSNPWNRHVRGVKPGRIGALFPGFQLYLQRITLLPPLARRLGPCTWVLYPLLAAMPFLRTHYLGLLVKPGPASCP